MAGIALTSIRITVSTKLLFPSTAQIEHELTFPFVSYLSPSSSTMAAVLYRSLFPLGRTIVPAGVMSVTKRTVLALSVHVTQPSIRA